jgi:hypothetical protein
MQPGSEGRKTYGIGANHEKDQSCFHALVRRHALLAVADPAEEQPGH